MLYESDVVYVSEVERFHRVSMDVGPDTRLSDLEGFVRDAVAYLGADARVGFANKGGTTVVIVAETQEQS
jgi:hypothetical protein